ncbi:MAG: hypothetical protein HY721_11820 [Planctomycetes bacterium]|nr:hypothetical protein [Planctomycetota bacterium]
MTGPASTVEVRSHSAVKMIIVGSLYALAVPLLIPLVYACVLACVLWQVGMPLEKLPEIVGRLVPRQGPRVVVSLVLFEAAVFALVVLLVATVRTIALSRAGIRSTTALHRWRHQLGLGGEGSTFLPWAELRTLEATVVFSKQDRSLRVGFRLASSDPAIELGLGFPHLVEVLKATQAAAPQILVTPSAKAVLRELRQGTRPAAIHRKVRQAALAYAKEAGLYRRCSLLTCWQDRLARSPDLLRPFLDTLERRLA